VIKLLVFLGNVLVLGELNIFVKELKNFLVKIERIDFVLIELSLPLNNR
jgi:hypothetical protein